MPRPRLKLSTFERALIPNVVQMVRVDTSLKPETQGHYIWKTTQTSRNFLEANQQIPQTTYHICCIVYPLKKIYGVLTLNGPSVKKWVPFNDPKHETPGDWPPDLSYIQLDQPFQRVAKQKSP